MSRIFLWVLLAVKVSAVIIEKKCSVDFVHHSHHHNNITSRKRHDLRSFHGMVEIFSHDDRVLRCIGTDVGNGVFVTTASCLFDPAPPMGSRYFFAELEHLTMKRYTPGRKLSTGSRVAREKMSGFAVAPHRYYSYAFSHAGRPRGRYLRNDLAVLMRDHTNKSDRPHRTLISSSPDCPTGREECYVFLNPEFVKVRLFPCLEHFGRLFSTGCQFHSSMMCIAPHASKPRQRYVSGTPVFCRQNKNEKYCMVGLLSVAIRDSSMVIVTRIGRLRVS